MARRLTCPVCLRRVAVYADDRMYHHVVEPGNRCLGSGATPRKVLAQRRPSWGYNDFLTDADRDYLARTNPTKPPKKEP